MAKTNPRPRPAKLLPRGIRNNNPLNIRIGNVWLGEEQVNTDGEFEQFVSMAYGLRAAFVLVRRYINHYRFNTISAIVSTWAPSSENNTVRYIDFVSQTAGVAPDAVLHFDDRDTICKIVLAMAKFETGHDLSFDLVHQAYSMA